ncbi:hypothetical protein [Flavobacterium crassostreae]|uniref:Uncharacterized protein n=1 Tax=Flavobacterium crassostreae TaxID=1763534 RepID=A0A1B9DQ25_9FLAO|nr:hypothetical protein [Flavobacterium crassostreae]OCB71792.1 hypothetical protein LPBF_11480 [Flavobacterium crassostreae]
MKSLLLILLVSLSFTKCKNISDEPEFNSSKIKDISEIVKTVILEDSLNVLKNDKKTKMFCEDLIKLDIYIPEKRKDNEPIPPPPPPSFNNISIQNLLNNKIENQIFFTSKDSLYLLKQNLNPQKLKIEKEIVEKINLTSKEKEINKKGKGEFYNFYEMTIPIFSSDNQKAYVELNHYCGRLCGSGKSIYLKKINGKWKIVDKWRTWIS